jgi:hypothetical protein
MAILIKPDGKNVEVVPTNGRRWTLPELQRHVAGYIEPVRLPPLTNINGRRVTRMYVNEEGLIYDLPFNQAASNVAGKSIVGNALVFFKNEKG